MARRIIVTAWYEGDADEIFQQAIQFSELQEAMAGFATYDGLPDEAAKQGDTYTVDVTFWGLLKNKGHVMHVETLDHQKRFIQSREHNPNIKRWDHHLSVHQEGDRARWGDDVVIDAGWQSAFAARFGLYVYRRRHRHRKALELTSRILPAR